MAATPLLHPQFDPVVFALGPLAVHWYGLMYLIAFAGVLVLGRMRLGREDARRAAQTPLPWRLTVRRGERTLTTTIGG